MTIMLSRITDDLNAAFAGIDPPPNERVLTEEPLTRIRDACSTAFDDEIHPGVLEKVMLYCDFVHQRMIGRAAGNLEDLIIRYLFRYYASHDAPESSDMCHMEVGVLFGAATIYADHATRLAGRSIPIVVVDPFEGYYGKDVDPLTRLEVTEENFWRNMDLFGIRRERIEIVKGFSTDPAIIQRCHSKKVLSILIDGDHSYEGTLSDWVNLSPLVLLRGYVLIDDYNNPSWPEIARCVDAEILPHLGGRWRVRLVSGRSLLVQRTG